MLGPQVAALSTLDTEEHLYKSDGISDDSLSMDAVIRFLRQWKGTVQESSRQLKMLEKELREKDDELLELRLENDRLSKEVNEVQTDYRVVNDDYKALIQIMDRARRLAFCPKKKRSLRHVSRWMPTGTLERIE